MQPKQLSSVLRQIANAIDASKKPSKKLVAADLRQVIARVMGPDQCPKCRGTGFYLMADCDACDGTGSVKPVVKAQPQVYVLRTSEDAWLIIPYDRNSLSNNLESMMGAGLDIDAEVAMEQLGTMDCALVVDPGPNWGVEIFSAGSVTENDLRGCDIAA